MTCLHYQKNELYIEEVSLQAIAEQFHTPTYVYSRSQIENNWKFYNDAFSGIPHRICYAVKANSNIHILKLLVNLNSGFDIVSLGELERVIAAGGDVNKIIFSGVGKTQHEIECAIKFGIHCFDVESESELNRLQFIANKLNKKINIALRVNPNVDPNTHAHISTGLKENKFGIEISEALSICERISNFSALNLVGLACHIGSQIITLEPFLLALDQLLALYKKLQTFHLNLRHLNIGGGLGISYRNELPPTVQEYANAIKDKIKNLGVELIIEPGRSIIANAGTLLTRVEYLKHLDHKNFAIVDAGMNDLIRPALYDAWQNILPVKLREASKKIYDIAGPVCESADFLGKERELCLEEGDLLAVDASGAYGFCMSSNYNSRCRPAEVLVFGSQSNLIRKRESIDDLIALERI